MNTLGTQTIPTTVTLLINSFAEIVTFAYSSQGSMRFSPSLK